MLIAKYLTQMLVKVLASSVDLCIIHRLLTDLFDDHYNSHSDLSTNVISFYCKLTRLCYYHPVSHLVDISCPVLCYIRTGGRNVIITHLLFLQSPPTLASLPVVITNHAFVEEVRPFCVKVSDDNMDRLVHSHGECNVELLM